MVSSLISMLLTVATFFTCDAIARRTNLKPPLLLQEVMLTVLAGSLYIFIIVFKEVLLRQFHIEDDPYRCGNHGCARFSEILPFLILALLLIFKRGLRF